jgi:hypothetical protein
LNLPKRFTKNDKIIRNKVLNHLETMDILEVERFPAYWTHEMQINAAKVSKWMDLGSDTAIITVGQYRSLLVPLL